MNKGRSAGGRTDEIYERLRTSFVADHRRSTSSRRPAPARSGRRIRFVPAAEARVSGIVETANFLGGSTLYRIRTADQRTLLARETHAGERSPRAAGDTVGLAWTDSDTVALEG